MPVTASEPSSRLEVEEPCPQLFSFGYWGWGNATPQLVQAVNAAEHARGFLPPLFVDIRIRRNVRAKGFQGTAFGDLLGPRYLHLPALGNQAVLDGRSDEIVIKEPAAASQLLDLALAVSSRRLLFFCACEQPAHCHRHVVGELVLAAAQARSVLVEVVEWPGGTPRGLEMQVPSPLLRQAARGVLRSIPLGEQLPLGEAAALPWASTAWLRAGIERVGVLVGPARFDARGYFLPVLPTRPSVEGGLVQQAAARRYDGGYEPMSMP